MRETYFTYDYTCACCSKRVVGKSKILVCLYCQDPLCIKCKKGGFCPEHATALTRAEKKQLRRIHDTIESVNLLACITMISIMVLVSLAGLALGSLLRWEWSFLVFFIVSFILGIALANRVSNSIVKTYERELPLARARVKARLEGISRAIDVSRPADLPVSWFDEQAGFVLGKTVPGAGEMVCPSCGALAGTTDRFCAACGARLGT